MADVVSLVADMVPELMMYKHWTQLNLGLRARVSTMVRQLSKDFETAMV